jgi:hypothetical protein
LATANFGEYSTLENSSRTKMTAPPMVDIDLVLTDQVFHFKKDEITYQTGTHLLKLFGKVHDLSVTTMEEGTMEEYKFYIPELITFNVN